MKSLLICLGLLCSLGHAQIVRSHGLSQCSSATTCASPSMTVKAGDSIFVSCGSSSLPTINTPTDGGSNTYTAIDAQTVHGLSEDKSFRADNATGFTGTISCNLSFAATIGVAVVVIGQTSGFDTSATVKTYSSTASPWTSNVITTSNPGEVLVTCIANDTVSHTFTAPTGFTLSDANTNFGCATQVVTAVQSATTYSWMGTGAADNILVSVAAFTGIQVSSHRPLSF